MLLKTSLLLCALAHGTYSAPSSGDFQQLCTSLACSLDIPAAHVLSTQFVEQGTNLTFPNGDSTCGRPGQAVSVNLCRVVLNVTTSARSGFRMEAWLPEKWSGRFLSTGNGGLGGCIQYEDIHYAASLGFAAVGTNNGHDRMSGEPFLNNPDIVEDFAYRALHQGVIMGKQITKAFYRRQHTKSYYLGCSTGGRQGFKEAQAFPEDFDGIVAGAPAFSFNNLTSWSSNFLPITGPPGSDTFVPMNMWSVIHDDILKQCDELDGLSDGILESPDLCKYNPDGLLCAPGQSNNASCLTSKQVHTVRSIYSPLYNTDGSLIYPRMQPGAELTGAPETYYTGEPFGASDWFTYAIFNDSSWDPATVTFADYALSAKLNLFNIETWDGNLSPFKKNGGKLLHYHGLADGTISSENSPRYYEHVSETMKLAPEELDEFYRYFRISGMAHCGGGPGASNIGNSERSLATLDPNENVLMAMVRWVEEGHAPDTVTGTAYVNGTKSQGVAFKRKHCKWPLRNEYQGHGDPNSELSWTCV